MSPRTGGAEVVVDHVSRSFEDGSIAALVDVSFRVEPRASSSRSPGPSGCGKSTLLNLIGALDRPDSGEIDVARRTRRPTSTAPRYRASVVGFVFQFHNLIPTLTAAENVQLPMLGRGLARGERVSARAGLLDEVGLSERRIGLPDDAVRRGAPAGRDRPGARERAAAPAGRRADRSARHGDGRADRRAAARRPCAAGDDDPAGHERPGRRPRRRPDPADPRRADRRDHSRRSASIGVSADRPPRGVERAEQPDAEREREPPGEHTAGEVGLGEGRRASCARSGARPRPSRRAARARARAGRSPSASLTISAAIRVEVQPTARMIPISRTRSNTDIAIVLVTPIPPMISASSEKIQPAVTSRRLEVSIRTAWPGSTTAVTPGKCRLQALRHVLRRLRPARR